MREEAWLGPPPTACKLRLAPTSKAGRGRQLGPVRRARSGGGQGGTFSPAPAISTGAPSRCCRAGQSSCNAVMRRPPPDARQTKKGLAAQLAEGERPTGAQEQLPEVHRSRRSATGGRIQSCRRPPKRHRLTTTSAAARQLRCSACRNGPDHRPPPAARPPPPPAGPAGKPAGRRCSPRSGRGPGDQGRAATNSSPLIN